MDDMTGRPGPDTMTRRNALLVLSATMMMSPGSVAQPARSLIRPRSLNNVMIAVSDLERSTAFYQRLFGAPVRHGEAVIFRIGAGPQFFALMAVTSGATPGFLSYGMTVEDFDAERVCALSPIMVAPASKQRGAAIRLNCSSSMPMA
jgi:predicted enzyme related to lactoylglutathione lyase